MLAAGGSPAAPVPPGELVEVVRVRQDVKPLGWVDRHRRTVREARTPLRVLSGRLGRDRPAGMAAGFRCPRTDPQLIGVPHQPSLPLTVDAGKYMSVDDKEIFLSSSPSEEGGR